MKALTFALAAALLCSVAATTPAAAADEEDGVPSFKNNPKRDTKEFVTKVGTAIVKAARVAKDASIELANYSYTEPKAGRKDLKIDMTYKGVVTKKVYKANILVKIDSSEKNKWEVLAVDYDDDTKSLTKPNRDKIRALIPKFNK